MKNKKGVKRVITVILLFYIIYAIIEISLVINYERLIITVHESNTEYLIPMGEHLTAGWPVKTTKKYGLTCSYSIEKNYESNNVYKELKLFNLITIWKE